MKIISRLFITIFIFALSGYSYGAEGLRTLADTAEGMALNGGRLIIQDDAAVVRSNPASLPKIVDTTMEVTYQSWHGETDFNGNFGQSESMYDPWKHLGSLYIAHPINDTMTAGLGITAPFGVSIKWEREGVFKYVGAYNSNLQTVAINPALGLKINDDLSIGFGLDIFRSKLQLEQKFPWFLVAGGPVPDGDMNFEGTGWGLGAYFGVNYDLSDRHHLALVGRLPVSVDYDGKFEISNIPAPGVALPRTDFDSEIQHPGSVGVGYAFDATDKLTIGVDFEWIGNSSHDDIPLTIGANQPLLAGKMAAPLNWDDSYSIGTAIEYQATESLVFRAGYQYSESPMNQQFYTPSVPANDRHILSIGAGYTWGLNTLDLAYSCILMNDSNIQGNIDPAINGHYDYSWNILTLSYSRQF